ncbi:hypothetical protein ABH926_007105 [Catenulispora sp. GP43]|uniref:hypothetical protein n=1 Tax=Catenulispora sp. GP43 TaxID=3156263 RepID=UPI00351431AD
MDAASAAETVAFLVAGGAVHGLSGEAAVEAVSAIRTRIREIFKHDHRAVDVLERVEVQGADPVRLADLASAIRWHAERDPQFAAELVGWATLGAAPVVQNVHAQRDAFVAGRDQTVIRVDAEDA